VKKAVAGYFNDPKGVSSQLGTVMTGTGPSIAQMDTQQLENLKEKLEAEIKARKDLEKLSKQIEITITPEGLRIELIEGKDGTFYEIGSPKLSTNGQELLSLLASELKTLPNSLLIEGHTDSTPYSDDNTYSNWDLSADRANSARRLLQQNGVRGNQVTQVRGYADQMLRVKNNPTDPSNRRISLLVKNDDGLIPALAGARIVNGPAPEPVAAKGSSASPAPAGPATTAKPSAAGTPPPVAAAQAKPAVKPDSGKVQSPSQNKPAAALLTPGPGLVERLKQLIPGMKK
jgi:chemotaxis protein MotB